MNPGDPSAPQASPSRRPSVAVVSPTIDSSHGTERRQVEWVSRLAHIFDIHIYSQSVRDIDLSQVTWHRVPSLPGPHLFGYLWWFVANHLWRWWDRVIRGLRVDLTYSPGVNCLDADVVTVHVLFALVRHQTRVQLRFRGNPLRLWPRLVHRRVYYAMLAALERLVFRRGDVRLAAISRKAAQDVTRLYGRNAEPPVIYHGLDLKRFNPTKCVALRSAARSEIALPANAVALLLIGNDWRLKGLPTLLEAVGSLAEPRTHVLAVGQDDPELCREVIARYRMADRVHFLPPRPDVESYFAAADIYVGPSREDAFALPPAEAMACGLPVIVSSRAGVSEAVTDGADGFILRDPDDARELAGLLGRLLDDKSLCKRMAARAVETAQQYTWDRNAAEMRVLFEQGLAQKATDRVG